MVIRNKLTSTSKDGAIAFHSQTDNLPSIMCASFLSVGQLYQQIGEQEIKIDPEDFTPEQGQRFGQSSGQSEEPSLDRKIMQQAAFILKTEVENMAPSEEYPFHSEVSLDSSEKFLPEKLRYFMQLLLDPQALAEANEPGYASKEHIRRKYITIAECVVYCIRREIKRTQITPPFHLGLLAQLHHEKGSRLLIDTLNSFGLCGSYGELRTFLTSVANDELAKNKDHHHVPTYQLESSNVATEGA